MKKMISITVILVLLLTSCTAVSEGNEQVFNNLKKQYPDAEITLNSDVYEVVSSVSVDLNKEINVMGCLDAPVYFNLDDLEKDLDVSTNIIFKGKKTGESKQYISVSKDTDKVESFYTDSKVQILEAFYGDIEVGDEIIFTESYAAFSDGKGEPVINGLAKPVNEDEYLYILSFVGYSKLYDGKRYLNLTATLRPVSMEVGRSHFDGETYIGKHRVISDDLYEKYIIKNDTALDKESETQKLLNFRTKFAAREHINIDERLKKTITPYVKKGDVEITELTDDDKALVDRMIQKYGEKKKLSTAK